MQEQSLEKVEQLAAGLMDLVGRYSEKIRAVMEDVIEGSQHQSMEELRQQARVSQEETYQETLQKYSEFVGATVEAERELVAKIAHLRDLKDRATILKEIIISFVKPGLTK